MPGSTTPSRSLPALLMDVARAVVLAVAVSATPALARQEAPPTDQDPVESKPADAQQPETERMERRSRAADEGLPPAKAPAPEGRAPSPAAGGTPAPRAPESGIPVPRTRRAREGIFIVKQRGELLVARTGDIVFVPASDAPARTARPMVLLPCQTLSRLESAAGLRADAPTAAPADRVPVVLTGQIMVYRQREYLLPSVFQVESRRAETPSPPRNQETRTQDPDRASPAQSDRGPDSARDREVEGFIQELEDRRTLNRGLSRDMARVVPEPAPGSADGSPSADQSKAVWTLPEGTVITARRGRLVRLRDGAVGIAFDNPAATPGGGRRTEAPMALLPCQLTQRLEEVVGGRGDRAAIEISGRVFAYGGRNYLLPTMYQVLPPTDVGPLN